MVEVATAQILLPGKGDDRCLVRPLDETGSTYLLAVADGLSLADGAAAASWVVGCLGRMEVPADPRAALSQLRHELEAVRHESAPSATTVTCGLLREISDPDGVFLRFEYFAVGDSPVWKVVAGDSVYPFQRYLVHGAPYPAEKARVYSTVQLQEGVVAGPVAFGAVDIGPGEVLVICTDGVVEREVFVEDFGLGRTNEMRPNRLCDALFGSEPYEANLFAATLSEYERRGVLFDDTTLIAVRHKTTLAPDTKVCEEVVPPEDAYIESHRAPEGQEFGSPETLHELELAPVDLEQVEPTVDPVAEREESTDAIETEVPDETENRVTQVLPKSKARKGESTRSRRGSSKRKK